MESQSPTAEMPHRDAIVRLGETSAGQADLLGGKALRLGEMIDAGLPVPPAFCVTTDLFRRFLEETGLSARIAGAERRIVRELITSTPVPDAIAEAIRGAYRDLGSPCVAVRSSASSEDSAAQSFAGQHDTLLNLTGEQAVLEAVRACWASLWSDRAGYYRDGGEGDTALPGLMAVVVQEMVQPDVSGVLFTVDPVGGRPNRLVVESCYGLGEGLVSGRVTSDFFVVDASTLDVVEQLVNFKVTRYQAAGPGRVDLVKVPTDLRNLPSLTSDQLRELADTALRVRKHYESEQDIEWAIRDGELYLLQTRPITTNPTGTAPASPYTTEQPDDVRQGTLWSRMDIGEIFVGLMTPLGLSFARHHQEFTHGACMQACGVRDLGDWTRYMGYLQGHVYLNVSYTAHLLAQNPPTKNQDDFTNRFVSEDADTTGYVNPFGDYPGGLQSLRSALFWIRTTIRELRTMKRRAEVMTDARLREFERTRDLDVTRLTLRELGFELERYIVNYHEMHVGYLPYYMNAFGAYELMTELCAKWLGEDGTNLQNRLKMDMSGLRTVMSAQEIHGLAQAAKRLPQARRIIEETPLAEVSEVLRADPEGRRFWNQSMEPFLLINGVRGSQEMELTRPRWADDQSYIFQMIRRYLADDVATDGILQFVDRKHTSEETTRLLSGLPRSKRAVLERVIRLYVTCSELREVARMAMTTSLWQMRKIIYETGRRLQEQGLLHSVDEVAYLEFQDIRRYLRGDASAREAFSRERIDEAQRVHEYRKRVPEPPMTFVGEYDITRDLKVTADDSGLNGLGTSPGQIVGRARIIEDLVWQADEFQVGEILVTRYTDASWTPLFAMAGGVVTDIGSMLSHSSIVAREFGVPSVVNTKNATQRIVTGDLIRVDGDTGVVEILETSA
ncbi:PEP/pyruvate-binding domain-containing protein [Streptomyces caeni]|uniref:PEP/pyruvate-binding domain-containing protein n=1 Tax=Streptomyces caeni TaxID=2307231 RepID=A0ABW4IUB1_9ACTN